MGELKMTNYHCADCKEAFCPVQCFQGYHDKYGINCFGKMSQEEVKHDSELEAHKLEHLPEKKEGPKKRCKYCWGNNLDAKKMTANFCQECEVYLCLGQCFDEYHSQLGIPLKNSLAGENGSQEESQNEIQNESMTADLNCDEPESREDQNMVPEVQIDDVSNSNESSEHNENEAVEETNLIEGVKHFRCKYCSISGEKITMTKYHCGGCKISLCKFPCFNLYHKEAELQCHQRDYVPVELKSDENLRLRLEKKKLEARNKGLRKKFESDLKKAIEKEEKYEKKEKQRREKAKRDKLNDKKKLKERAKKWNNRLKMYKEKLASAREQVKVKNATLKTVRKRLAVEKSLVFIMRRKLNKAKSNKQLPGMIKKGIKEFLLSHKLTPAQVRVMMKPNQKRARCSRDDILNNLYLRSIAPRAYEYLRKNGPLYLPSRQTMERWLDGMMTCKNGFNEDAIRVQRLKLEASDNPLYKHAQIVFDEIHLKESIELDRKEQKVVGPHKKLQTVMIRGSASD